MEVVNVVHDKILKTIKLIFKALTNFVLEDETEREKCKKKKKKKK